MYSAVSIAEDPESFFWSEDDVSESRDASTADERFLEALCRAYSEVVQTVAFLGACLLYTSDAADE